MKPALKRIGWGLAVVALTLVTWLGMNAAKAQWADHVAQQQALGAVITILNYNIQQGKLVVPPSADPNGKH